MKRKKFDSIEMGSHSSKSKIRIFSFHKIWTFEPSTETTRVKELLWFVKEISNSRGYAAILTEFYMIEKWIISIIMSDFTVVSYNFSFLYNPDTLQKRHINGSPSNVAE